MNELIRKIRNDLYEFDFRRVNEIGLFPDLGDFYQIFIRTAIYVSPDGKIYMNTSSELYPAVKQCMLIMSDVSVEVLKEIYEDLASKYPGDNRISDINKYEDPSDKARVISKLTIEAELLKREKGIKCICNTLSSLVIK